MLVLDFDVGYYKIIEDGVGEEDDDHETCCFLLDFVST